VTRNLDFKVTVFFNVKISKMVQDGATLTMANRESRTWSIKWCHLNGS